MCFSASGRECLSWWSLDAHWISAYGDLERNYCRNPPSELGLLLGNGRPFCVVEANGTDPESWVAEECDVSYHWSYFMVIRKSVTDQFSFMSVDPHL